MTDGPRQVEIPSPLEIAAARPMPWHRRVIQALLYGRNVDRNRKAKARIGLAILGFSIVYMIIAAKLVVFAVAPESHVARRGRAQDAVATARPDILDRSGRILATDVKMPSLFAEPRRIIDVDEAIELLTAVMPDLDTNEAARAARIEARLRLAQARDHAPSSSRRSTASAFPASAS